jgi:hypothetical protein
MQSGRGFHSRCIAHDHHLHTLVVFSVTLT